MNHNLQNLVTQLQFMENSMVSIILDFATKLAAITDLSIFVLVENQVQRKFTGSRRLTDAYLSGHLRTTESDVHLDFDKASVPLASARPILADANSQLLPKKRQKRKSLETRDVSEAKKFKGCEPELQVCLKEDVEVITLREDAVESATLDAGFLLDGRSFFDATDVDGNENYECAAPDLAAAFDAGVGRQLDPGAAIEWDVEDFLEKSEKLKYINTITSPSIILDKDSPGSKLLHSLIYELSKTAATFCPFHLQDPQTGQFFATVFESFWACLPYLQKLHGEGVLPGDKATSKYKNLKSLIRWKMQKNFGVLMRKYNIRYKN